MSCISGRRQASICVGGRGMNIGEPTSDHVVYRIVKDEFPLVNLLGICGGCYLDSVQWSFSYMV